MKKKLATVFFTTYILLGVLGFLLVTYVGSHLLENRLEKSISAICTRQLTALQKIIWSVTTSLLLIWRRFGTIFPLLQTILIRSSGSSTATDRSSSVHAKIISPDKSINLEGIHPASWDSNYYQIGDFYGIFPRHISARLHQSPRI